MSKEKMVLIVDDAVFMRSMLKKVITGAGNYEVLEAENGETALKLYREKHPGLVLLDISMPGINGIEVLKSIMQENRDACVIMCSAIGQERMIREAVENGAADFIVKPFMPKQIEAALLKAYLAEQR